ncbi:Wall-associated receptor kinase-like 20 [Vigna angularis]|uniref:Wall-associated receptor kinase-like 20 n=1 Tax=Phaseolus angularis TaxID=3914 RepID=A0A8T0LFD1_PHAAN|nr:Wall-associated receptor kinase-like 20 [Vigna angularis]
MKCKVWLCLVVLAMALAVVAEASKVHEFGFPGVGMDLVGDDNEMLLDSESNRRTLNSRAQYISYGALNANQIPCGNRGASYYNCQDRTRANPYTRGKLVRYTLEVFKGTFDDGTVFSIKRAKLGSTKGIDQMRNEVRILCQVNHRSLVKLLGCCLELEHPLLIYEYVPNGTLFDYLRRHSCGTREPLKLHQRLKIAHQTAEGLSYQHQSFAEVVTTRCSNGVLHHLAAYSDAPMLARAFATKANAPPCNTLKDFTIYGSGAFHLDKVVAGVDQQEEAPRQRRGGKRRAGARGQRQWKGFRVGAT